MRNTRNYRSAGIAMLVIGLALLGLGFSGEQRAFRTIGPAFMVIGIALLARSKRLG